MCGRIACTLDPHQLCNQCVLKSGGQNSSPSKQISKPVWTDASDGAIYKPSYNIAPSKHIPVLLSASHLAAQDQLMQSQLAMRPMVWGLVPAWHREQQATGATASSSFKSCTSNARAEDIDTKPTFRGALSRGRRCVVLAEGFYEWQSAGKSSSRLKQPHFIHMRRRDGGGEGEHGRRPSPPCSPKANKMAATDGAATANSSGETTRRLSPVDDDGNPGDGLVNTHVKKENVPIGAEEGPRFPLMFMAGVFDINTNTGTQPLYSCAVITVEAGSTVGVLHHRMPALLCGQDIDDWLDFERVPLKEALKLLRSREDVDFYPVSTFVNNARHDESICWQRNVPAASVSSASSSSTKPKIKESKESLLMLSWLKRSSTPHVSSNSELTTVKSRDDVSLSPPRPKRERKC